MPPGWCHWQTVVFQRPALPKYLQPERIDQIMLHERLKDTYSPMSSSHNPGFFAMNSCIILMHFSCATSTQTPVATWCRAIFGRGDPDDASVLEPHQPPC